MSIQFLVFVEVFLFVREFCIFCGVKIQVDVVMVIVIDGYYYGWGEFVFYVWYNESISSVLVQFDSVKDCVVMLKDIIELLLILFVGFVCNVFDVVLWDLCVK